MLLSKLFHFISKKFLGKEISMALLLLRLIVDAVDNRKVDNVSRFVYGKLPAEWRHPEGPVTEAEFVELVQCGQAFLNRVKAVLS